MLNKINKIHPRRQRTLSDMMWLLIGGMLLLFCIVFSVSTIVMTENARVEYEITESETVIENMTDSIEADIKNFKDISRLIMLNDGVVDYLRADRPDIWDRNDAIDGIMGILNVCTSIDSVFIFRNDGTYFSTGRGLYDLDTERMETDEWLSAINDLRGGAVVFLNGNNAVTRADDVPIVTIARAIYDIYTQKQTGILLMNLSENMLRNVTQQQGHNEVCILGSDGTLLAGNKALSRQFRPDLLHNGITHTRLEFDDDRRFVSIEHMDELPFVLMCAVRTNEDVVPFDLISILVILLVVFLVCTICSGILITRNVTEPILRLSNAIEQTKITGWLNPIDIEMPANEIRTLCASYNSMIEYLNEMFNAQIENEKTVQRAEMRVLYEQIKPHFLYNSLETIGCMAMEAGADDVQSALETLGSFYRNFLSKGQREIPLRRELRIIQDYLSLQKLRYGEVLNDEYDIDPETLDCMIPKLILQPLVENCINHGIRLKGEDGLISIRTRLEHDGVHVTVRDTGVGMTEEKIHEVLSGNTVVSPDEFEVQHGFGLRGTIDRIRYYCDSDDVVQIRSEIGEYTEIEITVPRMNKEES